MNDSFHEVRSRPAGDVCRANVCGATENEDLGVQIGDAVNEHATRHELDEVCGTSLAASDSVFAGIHHQAATFRQWQQAARTLAEVGHGYGAVPGIPRYFGELRPDVPTQEGNGHT